MVHVWRRVNPKRTVARSRTSTNTRPSGPSSRPTTGFSASYTVTSGTTPSTRSSSSSCQLHGHVTARRYPRTVARDPTKPWPYDRRYKRERDRLLAMGLPCVLRLVCDGAVADSADHHPALALHDHRSGSGCCVLRPACLRCQKVQGKNIAAQLRAGPQRPPLPTPSRTW